MSIKLKLLIVFVLMFIITYFFMGFIPALSISGLFVGGIYLTSLALKPLQKRTDDTNDILEIRNLIRYNKQISLTDVSKYLNIDQEKAQIIINKLVITGSLLENSNQINGEKIYTEREKGKLDKYIVKQFKNILLAFFALFVLKGILDDGKLPWVDLGYLDVLLFIMVVVGINIYTKFEKRKTKQKLEAFKSE